MSGEQFGNQGDSGGMVFDRGAADQNGVLNIVGVFVGRISGGFYVVSPAQSLTEREYEWC